MDEHDAPPMPTQDLCFALAEALELSQDLDLWLEAVNLTRRAMAAANERVNP
jgi:hypothetical protein